MPAPRLHSRTTSTYGPSSKSRRCAPTTSEQQIVCVVVSVHCNGGVQVRRRFMEARGHEPNPADVEMLHEAFVGRQSDMVSAYSSLVPECVDAVEKIRKMGCKIAGTTGLGRSLLDASLKEAATQGFVSDSFVAGDDLEGSFGSRTQPFMIYQNMRNLQIPYVQSVVKIDDSVMGIAEGLNAGCWTVAVSRYSTHMDVDSIDQWEALGQEEQTRREQASRDKLVGESGAHYVVDTLADVPLVIEDINARLAKQERP
mmetsp:Transcript_24348/g.70218  ORF Transcript_24348/g.70218 Transcript_24348/m.70218 type:complete len:256 (+) Transcript_24348:269-1036(+)